MSKSSRKKWRQRNKRSQLGSSTKSNSPETSVEFQIQDLKNSLNNQRVRRAFAIARKLLDNPELSPEYRPLLIQAYERRLSELLDDGHLAEGIQLYNSILTDYPDWKDDWSIDIRVKLECHGSQLQLLAEYEASPDTKNHVDKSLRRILVDPTLLARHESLPADSPLRKEAEIVMSIWDAIESGEDPDEIEKLKSISRRSPFNHWRLFLQGLAAFYDGDDPFARENIQWIPDDSSLFPGVLLLQKLIEGGTPQGRLAKTIVENVNKTNLKSRLEKVDKAVHAGKRREAKAEIIDVCQSLTEDQQHSLASDLMASFILQAYGGEYRSGFLGQKAQLAVDDFNAVVRRISCRLDDDSMELWESFLEKNNDLLSTLEKALIYRRIAYITLRNYLNHKKASENRTSPKEIKERLDCYYSKSVIICPLESTYRRWHTHYQSLKWNDSKILQKWHKDFPENEEVLFLLLNESRRKKAVNKVDGYFEKLKALLKGSPRLAKIEPFIQLERAVFTLSRKNGVGSEKVLNSVPKNPAFIAIGRDCLSWINCSSSQAKKAEIGKRLADHGSPYLALYCLSKIDPGKNWYPKLPSSVKNQFKSPNNLIRSLIEAFRIEDEQWRITDLPWASPINKALAEKALSPKLILELLLALRSHSPSLNKSRISTIALLLTANGLKRNNISRADMLTYRALVYNGVAPKTEYSKEIYLARIEKLLSAAKFCLSQEQGDHQLYQEVSHFMEYYHEEQSVQNWNRKSLRELIKIETKIDSVEKLHSRLLKKERMFPTRFPFPFNNLDPDNLDEAFLELLGRFGVPDDLEFNPLDDFDDEENPNSLENFEPPAPTKPIRRRSESRRSKPEEDHPELPNLF